MFLLNSFLLYSCFYHSFFSSLFFSYFLSVIVLLFFVFFSFKFFTIIHWFFFFLALGYHSFFFLIFFLVNQRNFTPISTTIIYVFNFIQLNNLLYARKTVSIWYIWIEDVRINQEQKFTYRINALTNVTSKSEDEKIWRHRDISLESRKRMLNFYIVSVLLHAIECCTSYSQMKKRFELIYGSTVYWE